MFWQILFLAYVLVPPLEAIDGSKDGICGGSATCEKEVDARTTGAAKPQDVDHVHGAFLLQAQHTLHDAAEQHNVEVKARLQPRQGVHQNKTAQGDVSGEATYGDARRRRCCSRSDDGPDYFARGCQNDKTGSGHRRRRRREHCEKANWVLVKPDNLIRTFGFGRLNSRTSLADCEDGCLDTGPVDKYCWVSWRAAYQECFCRCDASSSYFDPNDARDWECDTGHPNCNGFDTYKWQPQTM
jgi:hypothetical protein